MLRAILISLTLLLAAPTTSHAFGLVDNFRYVLDASRKPVQRFSRASSHHPTGIKKARQRFTDGRPRAWCGWWARQRLGVSNPNYNRAIAWLNYGHPTSPQVGAVVVWPHHVGIITGYDKRGWLVTSGNWNNRVATVPLSQMGRGVQGYRI